MATTGQRPGKPQPGFIIADGKKVHWTQTESGRQKLRLMARRGIGTSLYKKKRRAEILAYGENHGLSVKELAVRYKVVPSTIHYWRHQQNKEGKEPINGNRSESIIHVPTNSGAITHEVTTEQQNQITFAVGHITSWLTVYANSIEVPPRQFTGRVAELLLRSTRR